MNSKKKILIVDDEPDILTGLKDFLEFEGYDTVTAADGQTALSIARGSEPDLIILDLMLPKLDGYKVCRLLKYDKRRKHIPIIMLTAKTQDEDKELGFDMKANEYLHKPYDDNELLNAIRKYI